jgi:hypothetical protein
MGGSAVRFFRQIKENVDEIATSYVLLASADFIGFYFLIQCVLLSDRIVLQNQDLQYRYFGFCCYLMMPIYSVQETLLARRNHLEVKSWAICERSYRMCWRSGLVIAGWHPSRCIDVSRMAVPWIILILFRHESWRPKYFWEFRCEIF